MYAAEEKTGPSVPSLSKHSSLGSSIFADESNPNPNPNPNPLYDYSLGPQLPDRPPPLPKFLRRQTSADRAAACESIWSDYVTAIEEIEEPDGAYGYMEGLASAHTYSADQTDTTDPDTLKTVMREITKILPRQLEVSSRASMFLRYDEEKPQYMRVCLAGVEGTPYANGIFVFDIYCPTGYPNTCCWCKHVTRGAELVSANNGPGGFSPNLHRDSGKVCLSLLGTWSGPGWEPGRSNVYQLLSSMLWMILGSEHPYYNEPGFGFWEGSIDPARDVERVKEYDEEVKWGTAQIAILDQLRSPPVGFEKVVRQHFLLKRKIILSTLQAWSDKGSPQLQSRLEPVIQELKTEFGLHMSVTDARGDVMERENEVAFIRQKMQFLEKKCKSCGGDPRKLVPKAYQRLQLGPIMLRQVLERLQDAQSVLSSAELREMELRTQI